MGDPVQHALERLTAVVLQAHKERRWGEIRLAVRDGVPTLLETEFTERLARQERSED
jgi:hypothetical protein